MKKMLIGALVLILLGLAMIGLPFVTGAVGPADAMSHVGAFTFPWGKPIASVEEKSQSLGDLSRLQVASDRYEIQITQDPEVDQATLQWDMPYDKQGKPMMEVRVEEKGDGVYIETRERQSVRMQVVGSNPQSLVLEVRLPQGTELDDLTWQTELGQVRLEGVDVQTLQGESALGDVYLNESRVAQGDLQLDLGDLILEESSVAGLEIRNDVGNIKAIASEILDCDIQLDTGSIDLNGGNFRDNTLRADLGEAFLDSRFEGHNVFRLDVGSMDLKSSLPRSEYQIFAAADLGTVETEGQTPQGTVGPHVLDIEADLGDVRLTFAEEAGSRGQGEAEWR